MGWTRFTPMHSGKSISSSKAGTAEGRLGCSSFVANFVSGHAQLEGVGGDWSWSSSSSGAPDMVTRHAGAHNPRHMAPCMWLHCHLHI